MYTEILIDNTLPLIECPHYCRNNSDKIKWLALRFGYIKAIRPKDTVTFIPGKQCFRLLVEGGDE